jgi:hypothetical protein
MSYGVRVWNASGSLIFDGEKYAIMLADVITLTTGTATGSKAYPELIGFTLYTQQVFSTSVGGRNHHMHLVAVTYPGGIPTVSWTVVPTLVETTLYVFAN